MKKLFLTLSFIFLLSACGSDVGYGEARITDIYNIGEEGKPHWQTVIHCIETDRRNIIEGKVGRVGELYMSSHC